MPVNDELMINNTNNIDEQTDQRPTTPAQLRLWREFHNRRLNFPAILKVILLRFSIIETISSYERKNAIFDVLAGAAVGFVHVAQGLAYGNLAGVNPANGLYVSIFAPLIYATFGCSRHLSMGTIAIISLLIKETSKGCVEKYANSSMTAEDLLLLRSDVASSLAALVGIILTAMSLFRFGIVVSYLTDSLVSGYLCAAGLFVLTSQIPPALGFNVQKVAGGARAVFFQRWINIFKDVKNARASTSIVFLITFVPLAIGKYLNKKYMKIIKVALPFEIVSIVIATAVCSSTDVIQKFNITPIGPLPRGLPIPSVPAAKYFSCLGVGSLIVAIVSIALNFSIVTRYAEKYSYSVSMNQELFAYGLCNIIVSFLSCFPTGASISRTAVGETNLQRTQLASLFSSTILIIIVYSITKYLEFLPMTVLSAIVIANIIPTLLQIGEVVTYWNYTKNEGCTWIFAFLLTLFFDVDVGLFLSIVFSLLLNTVAIQRSQIKVLGSVADCADIYLDKNIYAAVREIRGLKIVSMEAPLLSYNAKLFIEQITNECGYPRVHKSPRTFELQQKILNSVKKVDDNIDIQDESIEYPQYLIVDCSTMFTIDSNGLHALLELNELSQRYGTRMTLCGMKDQVLKICGRSQFFKHFNDDYLFYSVKDAVNAARKNSMLTNIQLQHNKTTFKHHTLFEVHVDENDEQSNLL